MKHTKPTTFIPSVLVTMIAALSSFPTQSYAFNYGYFQSQATQGNQWFGSAPIQKEEFTITVYPDYLDVQVDLEISVGGDKPAAFTDALEIFGNVNLESNSTVIGMLLWNGNKILKAKLKTKDQARKAYEEVVDRNVIIPPRPKDPVLMEWNGFDSYKISIFPVEWGGFRKMRFRYLIPSEKGTLVFPRSITKNAKVTLLMGLGIKGYSLTSHSLNAIKEILEPLVVLDPTQFNYRVYDYSGFSVYKIVPLFGGVDEKEDPAGNSQLYIGNFFGNGFAGQALNAKYHVPRNLLDGIDSTSDAKPRIFATLMSGIDSCRKEINPLASENGEEGLKILAREPVEESIKWTVFLNDELKKEITEKPRIIRMEDGMQYARSFGNTKIYPWAEKMPFSLGSALGFIDRTYSLLALEEDVLPAITADKYLVTGVPTLNAEDIFPAKEDTAISTNMWSATRGYKPEDLLQPMIQKTLNLLTGLPQGMRYSLRDGRLFIRLDRALLDTEKVMGIFIYGIKGKRVKEWGIREISGGELSWSPYESGLSSGAYILKVSTGIGQYSQTVFLR